MELSVEWVKSINPTEADRRRGNLVPYVSDFDGRTFALARDVDFRLHSSLAAGESLNEPPRGALIGLTIHGFLVLVVRFLDDAGNAERRDQATIGGKADEHYCICRQVELVRSFEDDFHRVRSPRMIEAQGGRCVRLREPRVIAVE